MSIESFEFPFKANARLDARLSPQPLHAVNWRSFSKQHRPRSALLAPLALFAGKGSALLLPKAPIVLLPTAPGRCQQLNPSRALCVGSMRGRRRSAFCRSNRLHSCAIAGFFDPWVRCANADVAVAGWLCCKGFVMAPMRNC